MATDGKPAPAQPRSTQETGGQAPSAARERVRIAERALEKLRRVDSALADAIERDRVDVRRRARER